MQQSRAQQSGEVAQSTMFRAGSTPDRITRVCNGGRCDHSNNTNSFDISRVRQRVSAADCDRAAFVRRNGREPCPSDMAWVCSVNWQVNVCVDRDLRRDQAGHLMGHVTRDQCVAICAARGRRLLSNNEWLAACEGTQARSCLPERPTHPIVARLRSNQPWTYHGVDCKVGRNAWGVCMNDGRLNDNLAAVLNRSVEPAAGGAPANACVSDYGVRDMVGVLGQWVSDTYRVGSTVRGQFNGGLYSQPRSACTYTTVAHNTEYTDYSIGCRCGGSLEDLRGQR